MDTYGGEVVSGSVWYTGTVLACLGIVMATLPRLWPKGLFFGVRVGDGFAASPDGRRVLRRYEAGVVLSLAAATLLQVFLPLIGSVAAPMLLIAGSLVSLWAAWHSVLPHHQAPGGVREAELDDSAEGLPWWTAFALPPFAVLAGTGAWLRANWARIPERFPVHWGADGQPNRWAHRAPHHVYAMLWFAAGLILLLLFLGLATWYGSRRSPVRRTTLGVLIGTGWFLAVLMSGIALMPVVNLPSWTVMTLVVLFTAAMVVTLIACARDPGLAPEATPDECWHAGAFYYNPADPAIFVQKRLGFGYTFNFGNRLAWVVLVLFVAAMAGLTKLVL